MVLFFWLVLSLVVGAFGVGRKIGFWGTLLLSLFLSPLIGLIGVALSEREEVKNKLYDIIPPPEPRDNISRLKDLAELKKNNMITEEEYNREKAKLLGGY